MSKSRKRVSPEGVEYLKRIVAIASEADEFTKQIVIWLIDQTEGLTQGVSLYFPKNRELVSSQATIGIHDMVSANSLTQINVIMKRLRTKLFFYAHGDRMAIFITPAINLT